MPFVRTQIILSQILAIQNSNHTQKHKYLRENPFLFEGKTTGQSLNNFTIIKSIIIILVYALWLKKKKKISLIFLYSHTHKLFFSNIAIPLLYPSICKHSSSFSFHCTTPTFLFLMRHTHTKKSHIILVATPSLYHTYIKIQLN